MEAVKFIQSGLHKERIRYSNGEEVIRTYSPDLSVITNIQVIKPKSGLTNLGKIRALSSRMGY